MFISFFLPVILAETVKGNILHFFSSGKELFEIFLKLFFRVYRSMQSYNWMLFLGVGFIDPKLWDTFIGTFFYVTRRKWIKLIRYVYLNIEKIWAMWRIFGHIDASYHVWTAKKLHFSQREMFYWSNRVCTKNQD